MQTGRDAATRLPDDRQLGCFVDGRLIGQRTVADCARRNGVPAGSLDVGLANAVAGPAAATAPADTSPRGASAGPSSAAQTGDCARYDGGAWVKVAEAASLSACVRALFDGQCLAEGVVARGRWADQLLRLSGGRVEISASGAPYRLVATQSDGCALSATDRSPE